MKGQKWTQLARPAPEKVRRITRFCWIEICKGDKLLERQAANLLKSLLSLPACKNVVCVVSVKLATLPKRDLAWPQAKLTKTATDRKAHFLYKKKIFSHLLKISCYLAANSTVHSAEHMCLLYLQTEIFSLELCSKAQNLAYFRQASGWASPVKWIRILQDHGNMAVKLTDVVHYIG